MLRKIFTEKPSYSCVFHNYFTMYNIVCNNILCQKWVRVLLQSFGIIAFLNTEASVLSSIGESKGNHNATVYDIFRKEFPRAVFTTDAPNIFYLSL